MYRGHTVGVVIPAYNEEGFVGDTIESVPAFVDRVYVVEDGSTDGTWREICEHAATVNAAWQAHDAPREGFTERVVPIQHEANRGVGGAIKTGYLRARDDEIDAVTVMGGDGQMEPEMLGDLLDPIVSGDADYTKGNRFLERTDHGDMPGFRFVGNAVLGALTKVASGYWESGDPQSGYTAISRRALEAANIEEMYEFYGYCNDLLVKLNVAGMRVVDVPRPITYGDEESDISYRSYMPRVSWMLLRNFLWRLRTKYLLFDFHPLVLAYAAGILGVTAGAVGFAWSLPGVGGWGTPLARGGVSLLVFLVGVLALVTAMVLDAHANADLNAIAGVSGSDSAPDERQREETRRENTSDNEASADGETVAVHLPVHEWERLLDDHADGDAVAPSSASLPARVRQQLSSDEGDVERAESWSRTRRGS